MDRHGSIDALNRAWNTDVWSGRYGDWAEVMPPRTAPGPVRPSLKLDYRRFSSHALQECFERERAILRQLTPAIPVTTNFMRPNPAIDHWRFAAALDIVSCDIYPDPLDAGADVEVAFTHDLMRSLGGGQPWLVMEQAPSAVDWRPLNLPVPPAVVHRRSLQAVGAGADGIMFFQWRASPSGAEMLHSSMLPPGGETTPGWAATVRLGRDLGRLREVAGSRCPQADVAFLVDWESWWALEREGHPSDELRFRELALAMYAPLRSASLGVDMRHPESDLSSYRMAVAPNLFLLSEAAVANLTGFVKDGGILVVGPFSGIVQPDYERGEGSHPSLLRALLGIRIEEWWPIPGGDVGLRFEAGARHRATLWRDAIELDDAEAVARFEDPPLAGRPAITRRALGGGQAWYLGTVPDASATEQILRAALAQAGVDPPSGLPTGVELLRREAEGVDYLFVINVLDEPASMSLDVPGAVDLLTLERVAGTLTLGPQGVVVLKVETPRGQPT